MLNTESGCNDRLYIRLSFQSIMLWIMVFGFGSGGLMASDKPIFERSFQKDNVSKLSAYDKITVIWPLDSQCGINKKYVLSLLLPDGGSKVMALRLKRIDEHSRILLGVKAAYLPGKDSLVLIQQYKDLRDISGYDTLGTLEYLRVLEITGECAPLELKNGETLRLFNFESARMLLGLRSKNGELKEQNLGIGPGFLDVADSVHILGLPKNTMIFGAQYYIDTVRIYDTLGMLPLEISYSGCQEGLAFKDGELWYEYRIPVLMSNGRIMFYPGKKPASKKIKILK